MEIQEKEDGDPSGVRTRVTAVKGRCPRPLDDRVVRKGAGTISKNFEVSREKFRKSEKGYYEALKGFSLGVIWALS